MQLLQIKTMVIILYKLWNKIVVTITVFQTTGESELVKMGFATEKGDIYYY